ncbi:DUF485 domain-containing protein [Roseiconus nitratireducens]|uniref:DUF485 domain-containing protein n=1 Tax=Roseiconus nitratireducens TaxID=2605748 RepID=A0A5M6DC41_9BACT|nr:DUF485 domain-containing protein [Roseiconus nitratireducens]KAA5545121.1 DUF485 domain-containing protein [Roseiconus nitratireducens]
MSSLSDSERSNARLGLWLFGLYTLLYLGFVLISAFSASTMETKVVAGLNLAIVYGFALIIIALVMALAYGVLCRPEPAGGQAAPPTAAADTEAADPQDGEDGGREQ